MRILVLGGTRFLGRAFVDAALARTHAVSIFTRGQTNPELFPDAEHLRGDRDGHLGALEKGSWDAVVDTSGYVPRVVRASAELLAKRASHYTFVSSISAYADLSTGPDESSALATLEDETVEDVDEHYGALKALCEREVHRAFPGRGLIVRPGLVVGPHDPTDRFTYWPRRLGRGGEMLAPGPPERATQFIDVRDLAEWLVRMLENGAAGRFNAVNDGVPWSELLAGADVTWVDDDFLLEQGVGQWIELPLWIVDANHVGMQQAEVARAIAAGLTFRPVSETVQDTAEWDATRDDHEPKAGLAPEREAELLEAWHARESR